MDGADHPEQSSTTHGQSPVQASLRTCSDQHQHQPASSQANRLEGPEGLLGGLDPPTVTLLVSPQLGVIRSVSFLRVEIPFGLLICQRRLFGLGSLISFTGVLTNYILPFEEIGSSELLGGRAPLRLVGWSAPVEELSRFLMRGDVICYFHCASSFPE